jgi:arginine deiminase
MDPSAADLFASPMSAAAAAVAAADAAAAMQAHAAAADALPNITTPPQGPDMGTANVISGPMLLPATHPNPPISDSSVWKPAAGCEWQRKRGKAKSAAWDYFRVEVQLGAEQTAACEIICVHEAHCGDRVVVKAPSNTSNLHRHLMTTHNISVHTIATGSEHPASTGSHGTTPGYSNDHLPYQNSTPTAGGNGGPPGLGVRSSSISKKAATPRGKRNQAAAAAAAAAVFTAGGCAGCSGGATAMSACGQEHEDDVARAIIVCAPSLSKTMGALHPAGALYARPVDINKAVGAHAAFVALLKRKGVETHDVREILGKDADWSVGDRCKLEILAAKSLTYAMDSVPVATNGIPRIVNASHYVSDPYKRSVLCEMDVSQLVDIVMTNPTVTITDTGRDTGLMARYSFSPSTNILFTRDQQITTVGGVVMGRLRSAQRRQEVDILEFCLRKLGVNVLGRVERGFLEGGDFFPCGRERCFVGIGQRSTFDAVAWIMENNLFGTDAVVVVRNELDISQDRMHLDCIFNIIGKSICLLLESVIGIQPDDKHRVVDIWRRRTNMTSSGGMRYGQYELAAGETGVEFSHYLVSTGFKIISISAQSQMEYGCNVLNLGQGRLISTEKHSARQIAMDPSFTGSVEFLPYHEVTNMYGGVHCSSQVIFRSPSPPE